MRLLRQPVFETLMSFVISQNNHVIRITMLQKRLREEYGVHLWTAPVPTLVEEKDETTGEVVSKLERQRFYSFPT